MQHLQQLFQAWTTLDRSKRAGAAYNAEQWKWHADEIKSTVKTIEWDVQDLEETVRIVEANPQKFRLDGYNMYSVPYMRDTCECLERHALFRAEVQRRKAFVEQSKATIESIRKSLAGGATNTVSSVSGSTPIADSNPAKRSTQTAGSSNASAQRNVYIIVLV